MITAKQNNNKTQWCTEDATESLLFDRVQVWQKFCLFWRVSPVNRSITNFTTGGITNSGLLKSIFVSLSTKGQMFWCHSHGVFSACTRQTLKLKNSHHNSQSHAFPIFRYFFWMVTTLSVSSRGLILQDLTFVHLGNPDLIDGKVNFSKRWQQFNILDSMRRFQQVYVRKGWFNARFWAFSWIHLPSEDVDALCCLH